MRRAGGLLQGLNSKFRSMRRKFKREFMQTADEAALTSLATPSPVSDPILVNFRNVTWRQSLLVPSLLMAILSGLNLRTLSITSISKNLCYHSRTFTLKTSTLPTFYLSQVLQNPASHSLSETTSANSSTKNSCVHACSTLTFKKARGSPFKFFWQSSSAW